MTLKHTGLAYSIEEDGRERRERRKGSGEGRGGDGLVIITL